METLDHRGAGQAARTSRPREMLGPPPVSGDGARVDWVDIAKGICIILVVTMHATLGVEAALGREGFMQWAVVYSKPFRLPDFFLVSGLFLARVIDRDWRSYADRRIVHFLYFYVLWLLIQSGMKFGQVSQGSIPGFLEHLAVALVEPFSTLWFIYALAVFSVVTKLLRPLPPMLVLGAAAILQILPIHTSWELLNELCERWVYFLIGYMYAGPIFGLARWASAHSGRALSGLAIWALANGVLALTPTQALGATTLAELPLVGLLSGVAGGLAVTIVASLLAGSWLGSPLRYVGSKSLAVYLSFFLGMVLMRVLLTRFWPGGDAGVIALVVTIAAVALPLAMERTMRGTWLGYLYVRPRWARLAPARTPDPPTVRTSGNEIDGPARG